jgi:hypothetical protein
MADGSIGLWTVPLAVFGGAIGYSVLQIRPRAKQSEADHDPIKSNRVMI